MYSDPSSKGDYAPVYLPTHCFFPGGRKVTAIYTGTESGFLAASGKKTMVELPSIRMNAAEGSVELSVSERDGDISEIKSTAFQHDILLSWKDDVSSSWSVVWSPPGSAEAAGYAIRLKDGLRADCHVLWLHIVTDILGAIDNGSAHNGHAAVVLHNPVISLLQTWLDTEVKSISTTSPSFHFRSMTAKPFSIL